MGITEENIQEFVHLEKATRSDDLCRISFSDEGLFKGKFKETYVRELKSRLHKYGKGDLIYSDNESLYIKDDININFVKKIEEDKRKREAGFRSGFSPEDASFTSFPIEKAIGEILIAFFSEEDQYFLDRGYEKSVKCNHHQESKRSCLKMRQQQVVMILWIVDLHNSKRLLFLLGYRVLKMRKK